MVESSAGANFLLKFFLAPCKHKKSVIKFYGIAQFSGLPEYDAGARGLYHFLAWGNHLDERWFRAMNQIQEAPNVTEYVNQHLDDVTQTCDDPTYHILFMFTFY